MIIIYYFIVISDTDSDSFDGFSEGANHDSDFSEGSDFAPSPKKKKTRERKTTKNGKSSKSTTKPEKNKGSNLKCSPIRIATTSAAMKNKWSGYRKSDKRYATVELSQRITIKQLYHYSI